MVVFRQQGKVLRVGQSNVHKASLLFPAFSIAEKRRLEKAQRFVHRFLRRMARRFSCPRVCGPLRWEGRAIPARRRAILFCLLRSAIACRQICRNARSEEKRFRICMIGPLFSDLRVEGERQAAHSHLDFELAIRVPVGRNGFGFIVQTQDVCAGDRKVAQPAFDLRAVMRRRFKKVDI